MDKNGTSLRITAAMAGFMCNCVGRQNFEPYCPCEMRARRVYQRDGRWVEPEKDLGVVCAPVEDAE